MQQILVVQKVGRSSERCFSIRIARLSHLI